MVKMFSPCYFHVIISIGILESNSLSLNTRSRTKWTLVYLLMLTVCAYIAEQQDLQGNFTRLNTVIACHLAFWQLLYQIFPLK